MPVTTHANLIDQVSAFPGQIIRPFDTRVVTGINAEASTVIPFGFGVVKGTNDDDVILPTGSGNIFLGVATIMQIEKRASYSLDASSRYGVPIKHEVAILEQGVIAVFIDQTVAQGGAVFLRHTANGSVVGTFRADADTANALSITGARWASSVTVSSGLGIGLLILNRP